MRTTLDSTPKYTACHQWKRTRTAKLSQEKKDERKCQGESSSSVTLGSHPTACKRSEITEHVPAHLPAQKQAGNGSRPWFWGNLCRFLLPHQAGSPGRSASARSRKHAGKNSQNNWIYTSTCTQVSVNRLWKGGKNHDFIFYYFFSSNLKKKKKAKSVLILSRPVHKSQVINPHDIPGCWILHLELWKTDSWKIYKIPGSQCAPTSPTAEGPCTLGHWETCMGTLYRGSSPLDPGPGWNECVQKDTTWSSGLARGM